MQRKLLLFVAAFCLFPLIAWSQAVGTISTVAGGGPNNVPANTANVNLFAPAVDSGGNVYIPDGLNCVVYKVDTGGQLTVVAGIVSICGFAGDGGPATSALLNTPTAVAIDGLGNLFISDTFNQRIRRVDAMTKAISTYAGNGSQGYNGDDLPATSASLNLTQTESSSAFYIGLAVDPGGNLFIADSFNHRVRRVDFSSRFITTYVGDGAPNFNGDGGPGTSAELNGPRGLATDSSGGLYIADLGNQRIRFVDTSPLHIVQTLAGTGVAGYNGDGFSALSAQINNAEGVALDGNGNFYIADRGNNRIRQVNGNFMISTVAGDGTGGFTGDGGSAVSAQVNSPVGIASDPLGNLFIGDTGNSRVRKVDFQMQNISTYAGNGFCCYSGDGRAATSASINGVGDVFADAQGNFFLADIDNNVIRQVSASGIIQTVAGNTPLGPGFGGDGGPATSAQFNEPFGVFADPGGDLYIIDFNNNAIREVEDGTVFTVAGSPTLVDEESGEVLSGFSGDGGPATSAVLNFPNGIGIDPNGNLLIADSGNNVIRSTPTGPGGIIQTIVGQTTNVNVFGVPLPGFSGDGGPATAAEMNFPTAVKTDAAGNIFIADAGNNVVREVFVASGMIKTIAGNASLLDDGGTPIAGYSGDGGPATAAQLSFPGAIALDSAGNLFIADEDNDVVREVVAATGIIQTVAGNIELFDGFSGDGGPATSASLNFPIGLSVDRDGNLLIADIDNVRVRSVFGIAAGALPVVSLPATLPFGSVGQFVSSSMFVTLVNTGAAPLSFSAAPAISGPNAADFVIEDSSCSVGVPIASNSSCDVTISFTPVTTALETASLVFMDNATPPSQTVTLTGTGLPPDVTITPISPFGNQQVNTTSAPQTVRISVENATGTLQLTSITITGANAADFTITSDSTCPTGPGTVLGDDTCTVMITFTPTALGARTASLTIAGSNLPGGPQTVPLSGTGTAAPAPVASLSTTGILFGVVPVGTPSAPMSVTVTNTGNAPLVFSATPAISGTNAEDFAVTNNTCPTEGSVAPNGSCVVTVVFTPSVATPETATLTLRDNAANSPQTVGLSGGGPGFTFTPTTTTGGDPTTLTLVAGDTGIFTVLVTCTAGVTGTVTLSVGGPLPPNTILTISPPTITCPSAPVAVKLTLQTNCVTLVGPRRPWDSPGPGPMKLAPLFAGLMMLVFLLVRPWAGDTRRTPALAALALLLVVGTLTACVHNDPPALPNAPTTPAGTYALMIVGTGPTGAKSTLTLTVRVI